MTLDSELEQIIARSVEQNGVRKTLELVNEFVAQKSKKTKKIQCLECENQLEVNEFSNHPISIVCDLCKTRHIYFEGICRTLRIRRSRHSIQSISLRYIDFLKTEHLIEVSCVTGVIYNMEMKSKDEFSFLVSKPNEEYTCTASIVNNTTRRRFPMTRVRIHQIEEIFKDLLEIC